MIWGVDSKPPSASSIAAAKADGVRLWAGYFAGPGIDPAHFWQKADFDRVKAAGLGTLAFCSGWATAVAMKAQSASWGVPICLDVEGGIRGDGAWVQTWLDQSGAGLYGNLGVHKAALGGGCMSCRCGTSWTGHRRCHCAVCHQNFSSDSAFDRHRKNFTCLSPSARGLVLVEGYWSFPGKMPQHALGVNRGGAPS